MGISYITYPFSLKFVTDIPINFLINLMFTNGFFKSLVESIMFDKSIVYCESAVPWQLGFVAFVGDRPLCRGRYSLVAQG